MVVDVQATLSCYVVVVGIVLTATFIMSGAVDTIVDAPFLLFPRASANQADYTGL